MLPGREQDRKKWHLVQPGGEQDQIKGAWSLGGMASGAARLREGSRGRASFGAWS